MLFRYNNIYSTINILLYIRTLAMNPETELPEDPFVLHAYMSLVNIKNIPKGMKQRYMNLLLQHQNLQWEDLEEWKDGVFYILLQNSLELYKSEVLEQRYWYEIDSMIADVEVWLFRMYDRLL